MDTVDYTTFSALDIRVGTVVEARTFHEARKPALLLQIDFGELGVLKSSAQICDLYSPDQMKGKQVMAVVNFPKKQIANAMSECLVLGLNSDKGVVLVGPDQLVQNGERLH
jgi:tRNA-binding protein